MKRMDFSLKVFITLVVLCISGIVFSTIAIDKQIDSYIEELKMEIQIVNNSDDEVIVERKDNTTVIIINPFEETEDEVAEDVEEESYGMVTSTDGLNIRQEPSVDSDRVGVLDYGAKVRILEDCGDWYRTDNGFIFKEFVLRI